MAPPADINLSVYNPETDGVLVLGERYELTSFLDQGGMGRVYLANDQVLDRPVVVKILLPQLLDKQKFVRRFQREAQTLSKINHPHLLTVYDYGVYREIYPYIVTEYIHGISLGQMIEERGRIPLDETVEILSQVCDGLHAAHEQGVVHRDMKPDNILVIRKAEQEWVKIIDFGLATESFKEQTRLTDTGSVIGTMPYMAPEQFDKADVGPRTDVYSVGVVFYKMLTGLEPYRADTIHQYYMQHAEALIPELALCLPPIEGYIPELQDILEKALAKKPEDRYASTAALKRDLRMAVGVHVSEAAYPIPAGAQLTARTHPSVNEALSRKIWTWFRREFKKTAQRPQRLKLLIMMLFVAFATAFGMVLFEKMVNRDIPSAEIASLFTQSNVPSTDFQGMPALRVGIRGAASNCQDQELNIEIRTVDLEGRALPVVLPQDLNKFLKLAEFEKEKGNFGYTFKLKPDDKSYSIFKTVELPYFLFIPADSRHPYTFVVSARLLTSNKESLAVKDSGFVEAPSNLQPPQK